jgi:hypothetical protein
MGFVLPELAQEDLLLARARRGDRVALTEIYEAYFPAIYQFIRLRVDDRQVAEDVASEVFVTLIDTIGTHSGPRQSLRGWLFRVARSELHGLQGKIHHFPTVTLDEALDEWMANGTGADLGGFHPVCGCRAGAPGAPDACAGPAGGLDSALW